MVDLTKTRASILAVGTELTTGQITNRNAAWISERLVDLGAEVVLHETVADDRPMIRAALDRCIAVGRIVFVTGGLGPTSDDFTREVIAEWLGKPLRFHEPSWQHIESRLSRLGIPVAASNRQQCFYPEGARVLPNPDGTANGFMVEREASRIWVLPGPPREVAAVWAGGIEDEIRQMIPGARPLRLFTWQCLGKSEAELGEITESAIQGSGLQIGYRAHHPFVEIKVWCPADQTEENAHWLEQLDAALRPWIISRQGKDNAATLLDLLQGSEEAEIIDLATGGALAGRLGGLLSDPNRRAQAESICLSTEWAGPRSPEEQIALILRNADPTVLTLALAGFTDAGEWSLGLREGSIVKQEKLRTPYPHAELWDRNRRFVTELAIKRWCDWLGSHH